LFSITSSIPERVSRLTLAIDRTEASEIRTRVAFAILCATCGIVSGWILTYIFLRSVQPYPLDAFEEYQIQRAAGWMRGATLYGEPDVQILPEAYPPLYFWVLGPWLRVFGESFIAARLLSLAALAGIVGCGWCALRNASAPRVARLVFVTILLSFHPMTAKFFEVAKPDTMLTLFLTLAIVAGEHRSRTEVLVSSGALLLASLTKQNAPLFLVPLCLAHGLAGRWRWAVGWGAAMAALIGASYWLMDVYWQGQFFHWVFAWTAGHGADVWNGIARTIYAVAFRGPLVPALVAGSLVLRPRCHWTWCLIAALGVAAMGMSKTGGRENHLLPAAVFAAVLCARELAAIWTMEFRLSSPAISRGIVVAILLLAAWLGLPTGREFRWLAKRAREADDWVAAVQRIDGSVAVSHHHLLARRAGADCFFSDLILEFPGLVVPTEVRRRISDQEFDYLVLETCPSRSPTPGWGDVILKNYLPSAPLDFENRSDVLPRRLYIARRLAPYDER
jgi:hypothetical protein